jgi:sterol 14-demethylase
MNQINPAYTPNTPPLLRKGVAYVPVLGHALQLGVRPFELLLAGRKQHGDVFALKLATQMAAMFSGPQANEAYFRAPDDQLSQREVYQFTVPVFGRGVAYDVQPELMSEQLTFLHPALREARLRRYVQFFHEELDRYFAALPPEGTLDIYTTTNELTVFMAGRCLLGKYFREHMTTEFAALYHTLEESLNVISFLAPNAPLPQLRRRDKARIEVSKLFSRVTRQRREQGVVEEDFVQSLLEARYKDGRALTDEEITGLVLAALFGGQHTSAALSAWGVIEALRNPYVLPPLLREQERVLGERDNVVMEDIKAMPVLERLALETERTHPPFFLLARKVMRDYSYGKWTIPAGWIAMTSPWLSHRLPEVWHDPERFDPDRFAPPREEHRKVNYSMITFGGGKHRCVGMSFGFLQVRVILNYLLRNFELSLIDGNPRPNMTNMVVGPKHPCLVQYRRRKTRVITSVPGKNVTWAVQESAGSSKSETVAKCPVAHDDPSLNPASPPTVAGN